MGKRGPKPTPTRILKYRGSRRAQSRTKEPEPPPIVPDDPADVAPPWPLADAAREIWDQLIVLLAPMGILTLADKFTLARYCDWVTLYRANRLRIDEGGGTGLRPVYADDEEAPDPAEDASIEELDLPDALIAKLGAVRVATIAELEADLADGVLDQVKGIGKRTLATLDAKVQDWRAANPAEKPVKEWRQMPELWNANTAEKNLQKIEAKFGLTPADRVGLQISEESLRAMNDKSKKDVLDLMGKGARN